MKKDNLPRKNSDRKYVRELLTEIDCDPFLGMARIAMGQVPCLECHGTGKMGYQMLADETYVANVDWPHETCRRCAGHGREPVSYETRGRQFAELANYLKPKLKSVDNTTTETTRVIIKDYSNGATDMIEAQAQKVTHHGAQLIESQLGDDGETVVTVVPYDDDD